MVSPISLTLGVVVLHSQADNAWTVVMDDRFGNLKKQRVSGMNGHLHLAAHDQILLSIVLIDAVDHRGTPKRVARV